MNDFILLVIAVFAISAAIIIVDVTHRRRMSILEKNFRTTRWKPDTMTLHRLTELEAKVRDIELRMPDRKRHPHEPRVDEFPTGLSG